MLLALCRTLDKLESVISLRESELTGQILATKAAEDSATRAKLVWQKAARKQKSSKKTEYNHAEKDKDAARKKEEQIRAALNLLYETRLKGQSAPQ